MMTWLILLLGGAFVRHSPVVHWPAYPSMRILLCVVALTVSCVAPTPRSPLGNQIAQIKAIDNHAHPTAGADDDEYDALPVEAMEPSPLPARLRPDAPQFRARGAAQSPAAALDEAGIEIMLANRVAMRAELDPARFKWVPFADPLMYPLNNLGVIARDPDRRAFMAAEQRLLVRYLAEAGLVKLPARFDDYLAFVTGTLERQQRQGAVAQKFEMAYLRTLSVAAPEKVEAEMIYSRFTAEGQASDDLPVDHEYKILQDYLFRHIAQDCGRLGMPVHIHTGAGAGSYYDTAGANPMLLEPLLADPALRNTQFVLIHGGWPWTTQTTALLAKPNVWVDTSMLGLLLHRPKLAEILREWIEFMPERILFGTDAGPWGPGVGLEQTARAASTSAREALSVALTGMIREGEITQDRALELARMLLRGNARKLYGIK